MVSFKAFFARVDATEHRKWGARAKDSIVDGTSQWFIFNSVPLAFPGTAANTTTQGVTAGVPVMDAADSARPSGLLLADQMPDASSLSALATDALGSKVRHLGMVSSSKTRPGPILPRCQDTSG